MQRYTPTYFKATGTEEAWASMTEDSDAGDYYAVIEVDTRIADLERALKSCSIVLSQILKHADSDVPLAQQALGEVDKALAL
jgi:hypothetical protein